MMGAITNLDFISLNADKQESSNSNLGMQIEGLIPFKSSTDQAMASLNFMTIPICLCSFSIVKSVAMITTCAFLAPKKAYFKCLGTSFIINPS